MRNPNNIESQNEQYQKVLHFTSVQHQSLNRIIENNEMLTKLEIFFPRKRCIGRGDAGSLTPPSLN